MEKENEKSLLQKVEEVRCLLSSSHVSPKNGSYYYENKLSSPGANERQKAAYYDDVPAIYSCLLCNKCNVKKAFDAYRAYKRMLYTHKMEWIDPLDPNVRKELLSGKFTVVPASLNDCGCREHLCIFFGHLHSPLTVTPRDTIKMILFQLNALLKLSETLELVTVAFILDLSQSHYSNFDMTLCTTLLFIMKNTFPLRLSRIFVIGMPSTLETNRKIVSRFLKSKIRERVIFLNAHVDLLNYMPSIYIPRNFLPQAEGPNLSHENWLRLTFRLLGEYNRIVKEAPNFFVKDDPLSSTVMSSAFLSRRFSSNSLQKNGQLPTTATPKFQTINRRSASFHTVHLTNSTNSTKFKKDCFLDCGIKKSTASLRASTTAAAVAATTAIAAPLSNKIPNRNSNKTLMTSNNQRNHHLYGEGDWEYLTTEYPPLNLSGSDNDSLEDGYDFCLSNLPYSQSNTSNSNKNKSTDSNSSGLTVTEFERYIRNKGEQGLMEEYESLCRMNIPGSFKIFKQGINRTKCRYTDVPCLDETRVKLPPDDAFIHANWIDGYKQKRAFISAQGPLESTCEDFWHMIWSFDVPIIVMTTNVYEKDRLKCFPYWPSKNGEIMRYGNYSIENGGGERNEYFNIAKLKLFKDKEKKKLIHYHFTAWPDFDIPESPLGFLDFVQRIQATYDGVRKVMNQSYSPPIVVHCSAGIGRTGTFIVVDISTRRLKEEGLVNIFSVSQNLRLQRPGSIQMPRQYLFCYLSVLAYSQRCKVSAK